MVCAREMKVMSCLNKVDMSYDVRLRKVDYLRLRTYAHVSLEFNYTDINL